MTKKEKIHYILNLIKKQVKCVERDYVNSEARISSAKTGNRLWKENNPDDGVGGFGRNPYSPELTKAARDVILKEYNNIKEVLEFANDTFLDMIEEE